jgi:O-antigen ligase
MLLTVFVVLLGGRFTLDRLGDLPGWDLRWFGAAGVAALAYLWATAAWQRTSIGAPLGALGYFFFAWGGWLLVSSFWAPPAARLERYVPDVLLLLLLVSSGWAVARRINWRAVESVWWWLFVAGLIYAFAAALEGPDVQGRYAALGGGPNVFVRVMALAAVAAMFLAVVQRRHWVLASVPVFVAGAFFSGSRGGLVSLVGIVAIGGVPLWKRMSGRLRTASVMFTAAGLMVAPFFVKPSWFAGLQERFVEQTIVQRYDSGRSAILVDAWRLFVEYPVAGAGLDGYFGAIGHLAGFEYPHNLLLATAAEGGLIGFALLLLGLASAAIQLFRRRPLEANTLGFALCGAFMFTAAMFSGDYYDSRFIWFFLGLATIGALRHPVGSSATVAVSGVQRLE